MSQNQLSVIKNTLESPATQDKFVAVYQAVHGCGPEVAKHKAQAEIYQFMRLLHETPSLTNADYTEISAKGVLLDVISAGLSFDPLAKHVYVTTRSVKSGKKTQDGKDIYEKRLVFQPQAGGLIHLTRQARSVKNVTDPVIVYRGDTFKTGTKEDGKEYVIYEADYANQTEEIIAAFCYVVEPDGERNPVVITMREINRLKEYSAKQNGKYDAQARKFVPGNPNELYSSNNGQIDPGFLATKLVKKALKHKAKKPISGETYHDEEETVVTTDVAVVTAEPIAEPAVVVTQSAQDDPF